MPRQRQSTQATANPLPRARADLASFLCLLFNDAGLGARHCILAGPFIGLSCKITALRRLPRFERADHHPEVEGSAGYVRCRGYLSSQTSSMRHPLKTLLTMMVSPLT